MRDVVDAIAQPEKDVIESGQQLEQIVGQIVGPDFGDEAGRLAAALSPVWNGLERIEFEGVAEHRKEQLIVAIQQDLVPRVGRQAAGQPG
jgi:hypothetical protein